MIDLDSIHLTKEERIALRRLKAGKEVPEDIGLRLCDLSLARLRRPVLGGGFRITILGERWIENFRLKRLDVHWTRWLSIAAIIISVLALLLEMQGRGWFTRG